jgi:hypothetical protein
MTTEKELNYKGYIIYVNKENQEITEYSVMREKDYWFIIDSISYDEDTVDTWVDILKKRVDEFIESKGASEELEDEY